MKKVVYRLFMDYEKEEKWLNEMAARGLHLVGLTLCRYLFEVGEPGIYRYKIQLLDQLPNHPESQSYLHFLEDNGVEYVDSSARWVYLRTKSEDGINMMHSDVKSRLSQQKSIFSMFIMLLIGECIITVSNFYNMSAHPSLVLKFITVLLFVLVVIIGRLTLKSYQKLKKLERESAIFE